jgi:hypothetical protein
MTLHVSSSICFAQCMAVVEPRLARHFPASRALSHGVGCVVAWGGGNQPTHLLAPHGAQRYLALDAREAVGCFIVLPKSRPYGSGNENMTASS